MNLSVRALITTCAVSLCITLPTTSGAAHSSTAMDAAAGEERGVAAERTPYIPETGAVFARPGSIAPDGKTIRNLLWANITHTPRGATIKAATSITDPDIAEALKNAHDRGVKVRLVLPGNTDRGCTSSASKFLRHQLGEDLDERSWVKCIEGSARNTPGTPGHMHMKVWAFSRVEDTKKVLVVTSSNTTENGFATQYNDAYQTVGWTQLYGAWNESLFPQLRDDNGGGFWKRTWDPIQAYATPVAASEDPVRKRIAALPANPNTKIDAAISVIEVGRSNRATRIATRLIAKHDAGARIRVLYTRVTPRPPWAVRKMCAAGIEVREYDNADNLSTAYLHSKYMTASYVADGATKRRVWTGSEEWKTSSYNQDEFVLRLGSESAYNPYSANFNELWENTGAVSSCS